MTAGLCWACDLEQTVGPSDGLVWDPRTNTLHQLDLLVTGGV